MGEKIDVLAVQAALESGLVTRPQFDECKGDAASLVAKGYLSPEQLRRLRDEVRKRLATSAPTMPIPESKAPAPLEREAEPDLVAAARAAGQKKIGKHQIVSELGRGGMGAVHKAWDASLKRWVAIKILHTLGGEDEDARFRREAQSAATLSHPGIVAVYEIGRDGDRSFIVMECLQGRTLEGMNLPIPRACEVLIDVARAVDHAHKRGIIHRDLKPQNIMLDDAGRVHVMDFGLAKPMGGRSQVTVSGTVVGTPCYMPPEQADGRISQIDQRSDLYSLGAVLYELLTGRPPFKGANAVETLSRVVESDLVPPSKINPAVPRDLETVVLKALDKEKLRRYASAEVFARDLERFLQGETIVARRAPLAGRLSRRLRRQLAFWTAAVATVVAATLIAILFSRGEPEGPVLPAKTERKPTPKVPAVPPPKPRDARLEAQAEYDLGQGLLEKARLDLYKPNADLSKMRKALDESAEHFTQAIAIFPSYHEAFLGRGQARALQNRAAEAIRDFTRALEILPAYPAALLARGRIHLERFMSRLSSAGWRHEELPPEVRAWRAQAVEDLRKAREAGLKGGDLELCEASLAFADAGAAMAISILTKAIDSGTRREELYLLRGDVRSELASRATSAKVRQDLWTQSIADYTDALRMRANYHEAYRHRGGLLFVMGKSDECLADLQAGLRMDPTDSAALSDLGTYFQRTQRLDTALEWYAKALEADPDNFRALTNRSALRMGRKEYPAARADLERALKINPDHAAALFNLAVCKGVMGETEEAVKLISTILANQPDFARGYFHRGIFRCNLQRWAEALDDFEKAARLDPAEYQASSRPYLEECRKRLGRK